MTEANAAAQIVYPTLTAELVEALSVPPREANFVQWYTDTL